MRHDVDRERRDNTEKELETKLQVHMDTYNESQKLLQVLKEDKDIWNNKKKDVEAKVKEIPDQKESLQASLDATLLPEEDTKKTSKLTDEAMST